MRRAVSIAGLLPAIVLSGGPARALDCVQSEAVYKADKGSYTLSFRPLTDKAAAVTHRFALSDGKVTLDGLVMDTEEPTRTAAHIEKDCPEGDVTGDDIRACTGYEGYVYAISETGGIGNLPSGNEKAGSRLLFAGLGPVLAASALAEKWKLASISDSFQLTECKP